jgi:hypothetical protein
MSANATSRSRLALSKVAASLDFTDALHWCELEAGRTLWSSWQQDLLLAAVAGNQFATVQRMLGPDLKAQLM